jgi:5'-nucleotidase
VISSSPLLSSPLSSSPLVQHKVITHLTESELKMENDCSVVCAGPILSDPRVKTKDTEHLEKVVKKLVEDGGDALQFIVDFDHTITKAHKNGARVDCSMSVLENYKDCSKEYYEKVKDLFAKSDVFFNNEKAPNELFIAEMETVYVEKSKLLKLCGIQKDWFENMVSASNIEFREDTKILFDTLNNLKVPILVLSAGCTDLIEAILKHFDVYYDNIKVLSNKLEFDSKGEIIGMLPPYIHPFNKTQNDEYKEYVKQVEHRRNVVLMGDALGDLNIADGVKNPNVVVKIGFLNPKEFDKLEEYVDNYDVVLVDDETMDFPNSIVKAILTKS